MDAIYHGNAGRLLPGSDLRHMSASSGPPKGIGQPVRRKEDFRLLTGRGRYGDDLALPRMVHAAFVALTPRPCAHSFGGQNGGPGGAGRTGCPRRRRLRCRRAQAHSAQCGARGAARSPVVRLRGADPIATPALAAADRKSAFRRRRRSDGRGRIDRRGQRYTNGSTSTTSRCRLSAARSTRSSRARRYCGMRRPTTCASISRQGTPPLRLPPSRVPPTSCVSIPGCSV